LIGLTTITASMSVLLWALEPVAILLLAALVLRERVPRALAVAVAIAISGALLVVYQPGASGDAVGVTLTVVSIGFCALYTVLTRRLMLDDSSIIVVAGLRHIPASYAGAFLPLIPVFGVAAGYLAGERLEPRQWLGALVIVAATVAIAARHRAEAQRPTEQA
jgi:probable blue pigment (indigoidine) exporter